MFSRRTTGCGRDVATAASRQAIAGPQARSTQNRWSFVHTVPLTMINATTGLDAASAYRAHGRDRMRSSAVTIPEASTPMANSSARSGVNLISASFISARCGPSRPMATTTTDTVATMAIALALRMTRSSNGSRTYSWASIAIDQNARFGLPAGTASCTSRP